MSELLQDYTRGIYGFRDAPDRTEVKEALAMARGLLAASLGEDD